MILLVVALALWIAMRIRKVWRVSRLERMAAQTKAEDVRPLVDDVEGKCSASLFRWLNLWDNHHNALVKSLEEQLLSRPDVWGKGLWKTQGEEDAARKCAGILKDFLALPNDRLVPGDSLSLIAAFDGDGVVGALRDVEEDFSCIIDEEWYGSENTFADLIEYVRAHEGTASRAVFRERHKLGCGCSLVLLLILAALLLLAGISVMSAIEHFRNGSLAESDLLGLVFTLVPAAFGIFIAVLFVRQWIDAHREEAEERRKNHDILATKSAVPC